MLISPHAEFVDVSLHDPVKAQTVNLAEARREQRNSVETQSETEGLAAASIAVKLLRGSLKIDAQRMFKVCIAKITNALLAHPSTRTKL